jgi:tetratricopeptide (TPR) repeat protein
MELLVLALVVGSPWAFAAVHPLSLLVVYAGFAGVLALWAARLVIGGPPPVGTCPVALCLAGMVLLGVWQLTPLSPPTLAAVSPATAELRARLLPADREGLAGAEPGPAPAETISLDPAATRAEVLQLLALLALFAAVRFAVATPASFRRLAVAAVANGAVLSLFALAQRFSAPPHVVYWHFESQGAVFGPFVCRNHFPFYVNVCLGLGVGLLFGYPPFAAGGRRVGWGAALADLGRHPPALWLIAALGLMLAAVVLSLSRGGVVALTGATLVTGLLAAGVARRPARLAALAAVAAAGVALVAWFGADRVTRRLGTLWDGGALGEGRPLLWTRVLPLAGRFPVWGTGYGTFETVEPMQRHPGDGADPAWDHAHNDYLEALVEGGFCQLALALLAVAFVYRAGVRAALRNAGAPAGGLALGALFGITAVVVHSFGDFGMHIPAVALLVTVLAAHLTAAGSEPAESAPARRAAWGMALALPAAAACLLVALVLPGEGGRREAAERLRLAAVRVENRSAPGDRDRAIEYLRAAVEFCPDDTALRLRLADARYEEYLARRGALTRRLEAARLAGRWLSLGAWAAGNGVGVPALAAGYPDPEGWDSPVLAGLDETYLVPALRDYLRVRDENPLYARPHLRLAGNRGRLTRPDSAANYLERACLLAPADAAVWYLAGLEQITEGDAGRGWAAWRRSLECSHAYLTAIVPRALQRLGAAGLVENVLPSNPPTLIEAGRLPELAERPADRRVILARALDSLGRFPPESPEARYQRAWLLRETGRVEEAVAAYRLALDASPDQAEWRYEFAELLYRRGDPAGAGRELRRVLELSPSHPGARELNGLVVRARVGGS